jgi:hypothetical protein
VAGVAGLAALVERRSDDADEGARRLRHAQLAAIDGHEPVLETRVWRSDSAFAPPAISIDGDGGRVIHYFGV